MTMPRCMDMRLRRTFQTPLPTLRLEERMKLSRCLRTSYRPQPSLSDLYVTKPQFPKPEPAVPVHFAFGRQSQESKSQAYRPSCTLSAGWTWVYRRDSSQAPKLQPSAALKRSHTPTHTCCMDLQTQCDPSSSMFTRIISLSFEAKVSISKGWGTVRTQAPRPQLLRRQSTRGSRPIRSGSRQL